MNLNDIVRREQFVSSLKGSSSSRQRRRSIETEKRIYRVSQRSPTFAPKSVVRNRSMLVSSSSMIGTYVIRYPLQIVVVLPRQCRAIVSIKQKHPTEGRYCTINGHPSLSCFCYAIIYRSGTSPALSFCIH